MPRIIGKCDKCNEFALKMTDDSTCPKCKGPLRIPHPPRFSPDNRYQKYLREMKKWSKEQEN